ncbi:MAG: aspartyl protease family protein [Anaerolineales bacterium]|nr:aspartyl protease family protein [Anaerolineales bacterium]
MLSKINKKWAIPLVLAIVGIIGFVIYAAMNTNEKPDRGDILAGIAETQAAFEENPNNVGLAYKLADLHYKAGHFETAKQILQPLMETGQAFDAAKLLMGELEYLTGNYANAEMILLDLKENAGILTKINADAKLALLYYQTNEYVKCQNLLQGFGGLIPFHILDFMKAYGEEAPYQIDWNGQEETILPFVISDPLPIVEVEINGELVYALFDTGGDSFIVDSELAAAMGIEPLATFMGTYAGNLQAETSYGKADTLKLGDVTITSVPVMILPTEQFSVSFADGQYPIRGILGTGTLRQFLPTIDYKNEQIILRPKTDEGLKAFQQELEGQTITMIPFALAATHMMMAKGQLNNKDDLTYFVDSGLNSSAGAKFIAPLQTLNYVGIPVPELSEETIGGGGGYTSGNYAIEILGLGTLVQTNTVGEYGSLGSERYWDMGFIQDGLISHNFLQQYSSWTLDFTNMVYYFTE